MLSVDPDLDDPACGLETRTVDEARHKLEAIMTAVRKARTTVGREVA